MSEAAVAATPTPVQVSPAPVESAPVQNSAPQITTPSPAPSPDTSGVGVVEGQVALASAEQPAPEQPAPVVAEKPADKSLLGVEPKKETVPVVEAKPAEVQKAEVAPTETPLPSFEAFTVPEGVTLDSDRIGTFTNMLAELEKSKPDHTGFQKFGQQLVDYHLAEVKNTVEVLNKNYMEAFEKRKTEWKESFFKDPEIGGNRQETTLNAAVEAIRIHGGSVEQQADFRKLMDETGVGNHPAMIRMLANINTALREGRPIAAKSPVPEKTGKLQRMYGNMAGGKS